MLDRAVLHLTVIIESIDVIRGFLGGVDEPSFMADRLRQDAVTMRLQVIGEAVRQLQPTERAEEPGIDWPRIVQFRHRVAHDYRSINFALVWGIATTELDVLETAVRRMLAARGELPP